MIFCMVKQIDASPFLKGQLSYTSQLEWNYRYLVHLDSLSKRNDMK